MALVTEPKTIMSRQAAAPFNRPRSRRLLLTLLAGPISLGELSSLTNTSLSLLHHHLGRLLDLGLVEVSGTRSRGGRPIKLYRATGAAFFVPIELVDALPGDSESVRLRQALERGLGCGVQGVLYFHDGVGGRMRLVRDPTRASPAQELWLELTLDDDEAATLAAELRELMQRYAARPKTEGKTYIVHAALASI